MSGPHDARIEIAPLRRGSQGLAGFLVTGRWPDSTREWVELLTLTVRLAAMPGLLQTTSVYRSSDARPDGGSIPDAVGLLAFAGRVLGPDGDSTLAPSFEPPAALILLHPPSETPSTTPDAEGVASGCVLLPGAPHLGLDHRAAWVEVEPEGTVTRLVSCRSVDPLQDVDTAVLSLLMAA